MEISQVWVEKDGFLSLDSDHRLRKEKDGSYETRMMDGKRGKDSG